MNIYFYHFLEISNSYYYICAIFLKVLNHLDTEVAHLSQYTKIIFVILCGTIEEVAQIIENGYVTSHFIECIQINDSCIVFLQEANVPKNEGEMRNMFNKIEKFVQEAKQVRM